MKIDKRSAGLGAAALVAAFFVALLLRPDAAPVPKVSAEPNLFPFVRSLEGTRPDGDLAVAADDTLVPDASLLRLFDYYLSATGEKTLDAIRAEIENELERQLKPGAAAEAKRLLARYLDYKSALVELEQDKQLAGASGAALRARMNAMRKVRDRFFSAKENQAMFGFDDAYDMDAVGRLEISQNGSLSEAEKRKMLAELDAALPPALREAREAPLKVVRMEEAVTKLRAQGASDDEIYRMRAATFSPEAAARLAELDRDEAAWSSRIAAYLAERGQLLNSGRTDADRQAALLQLRQARFSEDEQRRLTAYE